MGIRALADKLKREKTELVSKLSMEACLESSPRRLIAIGSLSNHSMPALAKQRSHCKDQMSLKRLKLCSETMTEPSLSDA